MEPCYFLGANSAKGFYSKFDRLFEGAPYGKCFLIKGGPGTGKSTLLKKTAAKLKEKGLSTELIYCTADTNSLDAVMTFDGKFAALDATLPHAFEAKYPGAYETIISLNECWNEEKIREHRKEAILLADENRRLHENARRCISAAGALLEEAFRLSEELINGDKIAKTAIRICQKEMGIKPLKPGSEKLRFISAITDKGVFYLNKTPEILADKIYLIEDEAGAASRIFMSTVRKYALEHGFDIITCRCPIFPNDKTEHIFIPSLRLGFMTENKRHTFEVNAYRTLHARRFMKNEGTAAQKIKIRFALKEAGRILSNAAEFMREAKEAHDKLEEIYIPAMDFNKVEEKLQIILNSI